MNPKMHDYISIKFIHKELVERRLKAEKDEWIVIDKAIEFYNQIIAKWRNADGSN